MDKLYAPWRDYYVQNHVKDKKSSDENQCVFCDVFKAGVSEEECFVLHRQDGWAIMLNLYPYNGGHILIFPENHVSELYDLSQETLSELMLAVAKSTKIVQEVLGCEGINFGANLGRVAGAGIPHHVHMHIVPRWGGDTGFLPVIGETKQISVDLQGVYQRLKPVFDKEFSG